MRMAVIGIGSNSVRLLVAENIAGTLSTVLRDRRGTRLFASLENGRLSEEGMEATCKCVGEMTQEARKASADILYGFATSAVRDAENRHAFVERLHARTGLSIEICSGEEEAAFSYWGAAKPGHCGLIDIGGGSTELTIGKDGHPLAAVSLQMGAVRLFQQMPIQCGADVSTVEQAAMETLRQGSVPLAQQRMPGNWVGVGGTFTTLAAMDKQLYTFDRRLVEGHRLTYGRARHWALHVADLPLEQRYALPGLQPQRADIVVHGFAILMACMRVLGIEEIQASDKGNLEGFLKQKILMEAV